MQGFSARVLGALLRVHAAVEVDEDRLAGRHVAHQLVAGALERDRLAGHHHLGATRRPVRFAEAQRPDAERVAEGQQAVAGDQRDHRVRALQALVHRATALKIASGVSGRSRAASSSSCASDVDQHLGVALGVDVAAVDVEQLLFSACALVRLPLCTSTMPNGAFT